MKKTHAFVKDNRSQLLVTIAELIIGAILLLRPKGFTLMVLFVLGAWLLIMGLLRIRKYFKLDPVLAAHGYGLFWGLVLSLTGVFCMIRREWIAGLFPVLAVLYGVIMLLGGLFKAQLAVDRFRTKRGTPLWEGIGAGATLLFALLILIDPFSATDALWVFTGATMVATAAMDAAAMVMLRRAG